MYKQLIKPNLAVTGSVGMCLNYARRVFGINAKYLKAWESWLNSDQHKDRKFPKDVAIPLWFSYYIGKENYGHIVIAVPRKGLYSSPYKQGTSKAILQTIDEVERIYGCKYVGWSTKINGVAVAKRDTISDMYQGHSAKYWYERAQELRKQRNTLSTKLTNIKDTLFNGIKKVFGK